jgi:hypothetical protein
MKAQVMHDLREEFGFCSGLDLQKWFHKVAGDYCLSGRADVPTDQAKEFMMAGVERQYYPGDGVVGDGWRGAALTAIKASR